SRARRRHHPPARRLERRARGRSLRVSRGDRGDPSPSHRRGLSIRERPRAGGGRRRLDARKPRRRTASAGVLGPIGSAGRRTERRVEMTGKADFTEEEWKDVLQGPPTAGMMVAMAQRGGTFRETISMAKAYGEARKEHGQSELL